MLVNTAGTIVLTHWSFPVHLPFLPSTCSRGPAAPQGTHTATRGGGGGGRGGEGEGEGEGEERKRERGGGGGEGEGEGQGEERESERRGEGEERRGRGLRKGEGRKDGIGEKGSCERLRNRTTGRERQGNGRVGRPFTGFGGSIDTRRPHRAAT